MINRIYTMIYFYAFLLDLLLVDNQRFTKCVDSTSQVEGVLCVCYKYVEPNGSISGGFRKTMHHCTYRVTNMLSLTAQLVGV